MWPKAFSLLNRGITVRNSTSVVPAFATRWIPDCYITRSKADEARQHHGQRVAIIGAGPCGLVAFILLNKLGVSGSCRRSFSFFDDARAQRLQTVASKLCTALTAIVYRIAFLVYLSENISAWL